MKRQRRDNFHLQVQVVCEEVKEGCAQDSPSGNMNSSCGQRSNPARLRPIFLLLLASFTCSSVKSLQAFVFACDKVPRYSPSHLQANLNLASVRSINGLNSAITPGTALFASTDSELSREQPNREINDEGERQVSPLPNQKPQRYHVEYQKRKTDWANRYTSLQSLKDTFGKNKNRFWGDLDAASARRLYKTLLPKALLELVHSGVRPEDLAPLAYQARVAAKQYARYRSQRHFTLLASLFDGFRTLKKYGSFQSLGMSYEQVWEKYQKAVMEDLEDGNEEMTDADIAVRKICMRILESSCRTNEGVDKWILPPDAAEKEGREDIMKIAQTLENDVRQLLDPVSSEQHQMAPLRKLRAIFQWITGIRRRLGLKNAHD